MNFGEKVRKARRALGMTQIELAKKIGVTNRAITSYETGRSFPRTREGYRKLAEALQVDVNYLLSEDDAFISDAARKYGSRGRAEADRLVAQMGGLFAGGELTEEDKQAVFLALQEAYWDAKAENRKYGRRNSK